jgi:hypothetical protein
MIDDRVFGDLDSFRAQFTQPNREQAFAALRSRCANLQAHLASPSAAVRSLHGPQRHR